VHHVSTNSVVSGLLLEELRVSCILLGRISCSDNFLGTSIQLLNLYEKTRVSQTTPKGISLPFLN
jgi:hypothetical protein